MTTYFLDTSALIKRYISEQGSSEIVALCDPAQGNIIYISQAARIEVMAALCRRERRHTLTEIGILLLINRRRIEREMNFCERQRTKNC